MEKKNQRRIISGILAIIMTITGVGIPLPFPSNASDIWPQKSTVPYYCIDGGKGWKKVDRYDLYQYDTMPSPLTEIQAKRLFWAYPDNWSALKNAAKKFDPELYTKIRSVVSSANLVKYVKDDAGTMFSWVADHPEIEKRAIAAMEQASSESLKAGKEAPSVIRGATSEDAAVPFQVPPFSDGPGALDTEFVLGKEFVRDIAKIEPQSVWDNGSSGGTEGWLDASQDKNIAKSAMGENLYEVTWKGDSIRIHNNGSAAANENIFGSDMTEEEKYNKTTVRYKITMRKDSGWYTEGSWNPDYLHEWMDFKACVNAPEHQRLYKADMRIVPSDQVFYLVISQDGREVPERPEYGTETPSLEFQIYRHEETFSSNYNVKLIKYDDETRMPLKGSQFYLYEQFEDHEKLSKEDGEGKLSEKNLSFRPWSGFRIFAEGTTNDKGEIIHRDTRKYTYSKTYCDGHPVPSWAEMKEKEDGNESDAYKEAKEQTGDNNRAAARQWMELVEACEEKAEKGGHFHWIADKDAYDEVDEVLESGTAKESGRSSKKTRASLKSAFETSGCMADCEETYQKFLGLRFTYTWKEIQARTGYILHDLHEDDLPVEMVTTDSSEAGANAVMSSGNSRDISENIWYSGNGFKKISSISEKIMKHVKRAAKATDSDAEKRITTPSNAKKQTLFQSFYDMFSRNGREEEEDENWGKSEHAGDFEEVFSTAKKDGIHHLETEDSGRFSHGGGNQENAWQVYDHRTEGRIHINKKDRELFRGESEQYSSYGDTEGDGTLQGAVYGLFVAEDIVHPDTDLTADGKFTNTGIVYRKNDLTSVAVTDQDGNAEFLSYTQAPGMEYDYASGTIRKRTDISWDGPQNRYLENETKYGNCWIGRPLILGKYYVKELSRSTGYELSVNGADHEITNRGSGFQTPDFITEANGMAVLSMPELAASMEGEDGSGKGYDEILFTVTSSGTDTGEENGGYEIFAYGFPEGTKFFRVDTGEEFVTGPHVTGREEVVVKDASGKIVWKRAESDFSDICYQPERDKNGTITGQEPMSRMEPQIVKAEQIPEKKQRKFFEFTIDEEDVRFQEKLEEVDLSSETSESFLFLKAQTEKFLGKNGYGVPVTAEGLRSTETMAVYSRGVKKGQPDLWGMSTAQGETAEKTVYGSAVQEVSFPVGKEECMLDLMRKIFSWYQEHPQWSFGGIDAVRKEKDGYRITLYAGASSAENRRFFTSKTENGKKTADTVYAVYEDTKNMRWGYQEYKKDGAFRFTVDRQYVIGSGNAKRYYMDATLTPALMMGNDGKLTELMHQTMVYHKKGEEIKDYLSGDPAHGYRVPLTKTEDKIEITTEREIAEKDAELSGVIRDEKTGTYQVPVRTSGTDSFGKKFSDKKESLALQFAVKLPKKNQILTEADIKKLGNANIRGYKAGDRIGYAEYLMQFSDAALAVSVSENHDLSDTYIVTKRLVYRGQEKVTEDGDTRKIPVTVLERPVKQKVKIEKKTDDGKNIGNFRFKIYLKSNLERLFCAEDGTITWTDKNGAPVDIEEYRRNFPELVQKIYTKQEKIQILEKSDNEKDSENGNQEPAGMYQYEKFFDAVRTADTDKWKRKGEVWNTSFKPFAFSRLTGKENTINTSEYAKENAKRSDAVRQFAVDWYLKEEQKALEMETCAYPDERYDRALYQAIEKAEKYLKPFFLYDLGKIYAIEWDSEEDGGRDGDPTTLSADKKEGQKKEEAAIGISKYLPYGTYVIAEEQPYAAEKHDLLNRHYKTDAPKEIFLPEKVKTSEEIHDPVQVPWSVTDPEEQMDEQGWTGYGERKFLNRRYAAKFRIEKLDAETGEPILHDDAVFGIYRAQREEKDGDGSVKRYQADTMITGSRYFLEAMGAVQIRPFARRTGGAGEMYYGTVLSGTPVCYEKDLVRFADRKGLQTGNLLAVPTIRDLADIAILQAVGYAWTEEPIAAGVYVLAELKAPAGYVRAKPVAVEVYSDRILYSEGNGEKKKAAAVYGYDEDTKTQLPGTMTDTARIFVKNNATILEISKIKTMDSIRGMKLSGRVEGTISELQAAYGLENLDLAYNAMGTYLGFGWKKGTLEMLEQRKRNGERIEIVYENGIFQGYGYVMRKLETSEHKNKCIPGAELVLYDAVRVRRSGDSEDYAFEGVEVRRDRNGNVEDIFVKEGYAGEKPEFTREISEEENQIGQKETWKVRTVKRNDTPVLYYDLGNLEVIKKGKDGTLYGYDKNGQMQKLTFDTKSLYALKNGHPVFELSGGDLSKIVYDRRAKAFLKVDRDTTLYHLDENLCRDAQVDSYTGLAYVEKTEIGENGREQTICYVWPVTKETDVKGNLIGRRKILTGRPAEIMEGSEHAYLTGSWNPETGKFEKRMAPVYDAFGLVKYYPESSAEYQKGEIIKDRDGDYVTYRYDDLLELYNRAAYGIKERNFLFEIGDPEKEKDGMPLKHRRGEAYLIPNVWISGERTIQDGIMDESTDGQPDLLRRVIPGSYLLEERHVPDGYVRAFPEAVEVKETEETQKVWLVDEKTKVEILKADGTENYRKTIENRTDPGAEETGIELRGAYSQTAVRGAKLALFRAKRVPTQDKRYPNGYYLEKEEETPAVWNTEDPVDNHKISVTAEWITDGTPKYFEGIPVGDYILEELETPQGYVPASMEITVKETEELQSFLFYNDHTKLEILKYERDRSGDKIPLSWPAAAEFTLCEAVLDEDGKPRTENGAYLYRKDRVIDSWKADDLSEYIPMVPEAYEKMYRQYGKRFRQFSCKNGRSGTDAAEYAVLSESTSTENGEITVQTWRMPDGTDMRVTVSENGRAKETDSFGKPQPLFEYQFRYQKEFHPDYPEMVRYDTRAGLHRINRIPAGTYVLLETKIPDGYQNAEPVLVTVEQTEDVIRYEVENKKKPEETVSYGRIRIRKTDADDQERKLSGAWFEVQCEKTGERAVFTTGEDGIALSPELPAGWMENGTWNMYEYQVREIQPPPGYGCLQEEWKISFDREEEKKIQLYELTVKDEKTKVWFYKFDMVTGEELPGAALELKTLDGKTVDTWISGKTPHRIEGSLEAGKTYILTETSAPSGYEISESIRFTVPEDGSLLKVEMTDKRKPSEKPEEPTKPTEPEKPEKPTVPTKPEQPEIPHEKPKKPVEAEWTKPEDAPQKEKSYGTIVARYERKSLENARENVRQKDRISLKTPETGDHRHPELAWIGMFFGAFGIWYLNRRRKEDEKNEDHDLEEK